MNSTPTDQTDALRIQVAQLTSTLDRVQAWRDRAAAHADENGLIDQHRLITLDKALADVQTAQQAFTIETTTEYDVLISTPMGDMSTSSGTGQTETHAELRMRSNEGRNPRRLSRTVTTITTEWIPA